MPSVAKDSPMGSVRNPNERRVKATRKRLVKIDHETAGLSNPRFFIIP
jgi:hypothetical protein